MRCSGVGVRCRGVGRQTRYGVLKSTTIPAPEGARAGLFPINTAPVVSQINNPFTYGIAECRGVACEQSRFFPAPPVAVSYLHSHTLSISASNC